MNLRVLKKSQRQPEVGDVFVMQLDGKNFLFGRVVSIDANPLGVGGGILIYIYRAKAPCKTSVPTLDRNCLLIPPLITNKLPWSRGYFEYIQARPIAMGDVLAHHHFWDPLRGVFRDEQGNVAPDPSEPCSTWGLHSFQTIDDELSKKLGLRLSVD
jgi:Immunity protein 26